MTDDAHTCARCAVTFRPARTDHACPICRTPAPGQEGSGAASGIDHRVLLVGIGAVDFLVLALVAWWVFG